LKTYTNIKICTETYYVEYGEGRYVGINDPTNYAFLGAVAFADDNTAEDC
jgi:hypothetical protein